MKREREEEPGEDDPNPIQIKSCDLSPTDHDDPNVSSQLIVDEPYNEAPNDENSVEEQVKSPEGISTTAESSLAKPVRTENPTFPDEATGSQRKSKRLRKSTRNDDEFIHSVNKQEKYDYEYLYFITNILPQVFNLSGKQLKQKYPKTYLEPIVAKLKLTYVKQVAYPIN